MLSKIRKWKKVVEIKEISNNLFQHSDKTFSEKIILSLDKKLWDLFFKIKIDENHKEEEILKLSEDGKI